MKSAALPVLLLAGACIPEEGPMMAPFQDCLGCHGAGGEARAWTVAGTWAKGARVTVTDANGKVVALRGNDAGNFYTAEPLVFPLTASVDGRLMARRATPAVPLPLAYGGCNVCHRAEAITTGPLMAPGHDCLACHRPGGMAPAFSVAGTFAPAAAIDVGGLTTTANAVGNFFFYADRAPLAFSAAAPVPAAVNGAAMPAIEGQPAPGAPYGGCNRCHGRRGEDD